MKDLLMHLGKGLVESKMDKVLGKTPWMVDEEVVWLVAKCNNVRPMLDCVVVTNARVVGLMSRELKVSHLFRDIATTDYNPAARTVTITDHQNASTTFKAIAPEDVPAVQHYIDFGRQHAAASPVVDRIDHRDENDPGKVALEGPIGNLPAKAQRKLIPALSEGERVLLAVEGEYAALVATDRRILITKWGITSGAMFTSQVNSWDLRNIAGIESRKGMTTNSIVIQSPGTAPVTAFGRFDHGPASVHDAPNALFITTSKPAATIDGANLKSEGVVSRLRDMVAEAHFGTTPHAVAAPAPQAPASSPPSAAVAAAPSLADQIRELAQLRDEGLITNDDFETKKRQLLGL